MDKIKRYFITLYKQGRTFGYPFMLQCFIRRIVSFRLYERYMYNYLTKYFSELINEFKVIENQESKKVMQGDPFHIWSLWWQGEDNAPDIVKRCLESQRKMLIFSGIEYHVLTEDNWNDYIELPEFILKKVSDGRITLTHFSDIIRAELLRKYGGVWIDATVYCTEPVDLRKQSNPFFSVKAHEYSNFYTLRRWTGFFIGDEKNSLLFDFMAEAFRYYWKKENDLIVYLLIDYLIAIAYDQFDSVRKNIDAVCVSNTELWSMLRKMNHPYDQHEWQQMTSSTTFFKLSYKDEFNGGPLQIQTLEGIETFYGRICREDGIGEK